MILRGPFLGKARQPTVALVIKRTPCGVEFTLVVWRVKVQCELLDSFGREFAAGRARGNRVVIGRLGPVRIALAWLGWVRREAVS